MVSPKLQRTVESPGRHRLLLLFGTSWRAQETQEAGGMKKERAVLLADIGPKAMSDHIPQVQSERICEEME